MIRIAVLGVTGSIGQSTLAVVKRHPDRFKIVAAAARTSAQALDEIAAAHEIDNVALAEPEALDGFEAHSTAVWTTGTEAVEALACRDDVDVVVNALVGAVGLRSTLAALKAGKRCALANKESLVAGGDLVLEAAQSGGGELVPVDSEHSAILQCMSGHGSSDVSRLILTASGGPFRELSRARLETVTAIQALRHPTWDMGSKITIDSATLANKALEVIEAHFLFGLSYDAIEAVVHPTSIVHSFVEFVDGSVVAQMGQPTMELPILYALSWPERFSDSALKTFDPVSVSPMTFEAIDLDRFPLFGLGVGAGRKGGGAPAVFNAANEIAVSAFLEGSLGFYGMAAVVEGTLSALGDRSVPDFESVVALDQESRRIAVGLAETQRAKLG